MRLRAAALAVLTIQLTLTAPTPVDAAEVTDRDLKVGRLHRAYVDPLRRNWTGDGPRPVATTIWYRARDDSVETDWRVGVFLYGRTAAAAPFHDSRRRPLIVLSHGTGGSAGQVSWLAEALVRDGYLVAAVSHHGNTTAEETPVVGGWVLPGERARDLSVMIDRLLADDAFGPRIDSGRIGAAGFALGGFTVLSVAGLHLSFDEIRGRCAPPIDSPACTLPPEAPFTAADVQASFHDDPQFQAAVARSLQSARDPRVRAVYPIAPTWLSLVPLEQWAAIQVPTRFVLADADRKVPFASTEALIRQVLPEAGIVEVTEAGHYVFLAVCTLRGLLRVGTLCRDPEVTDRAEVHDRIGRDAAAFFDRRLPATASR